MKSGVRGGCDEAHPSRTELFGVDLAIAAAARLCGLIIAMVFGLGDADARSSENRRTCPKPNWLDGVPNLVAPAAVG
jgi:hypothetical protein